MILIYRGIRGYMQRRAATRMAAAAVAPTSIAGRERPVDPDAAISVRGLRMAYGPLEAVRGIDLDVRRGEIVAFLGPNGAGKTTTVEILEGYRQRTGGEVRVLGEDPGARRSPGASASASCSRSQPSSPTSPPARCWSCTPAITPTRAR